MVRCVRLAELSACCRGGGVDAGWARPARCCLARRQRGSAAAAAADRSDSAVAGEREARRRTRPMASSVSSYDLHQ